MPALDALLSTRLFAGLAPENLEPLVAKVRRLDLPSGAFIFRSGDPAHEIWVLVSGQAKMWVPGDGGEELVLDIIRPFDVFGLPGALSDDADRVTHVMTTEASSALSIATPAFLDFLESHPLVMRRTLARLSDLVRADIRAMHSIAYQQIDRRVARRLLDLAELHGQPVEGGIRIDTRIPQSTLSAMVGATREGVNRALSSFARQGLLALTGGHIVLYDLDELTRRSASVLPDRSGPINRSG